MVPAVVAEGILVYEIIQVIVAFIAVCLAMRWRKTELLAGLTFLFIYTLLELVDTYLLTFTRSVFFDVAQFGFILLALIFFIIGMNPAWAHHGAPDKGTGNDTEQSPGKPAIFSQLRKL